MVEEFMKWRASDGEEFDTRPAAEAHEATLALGSVEREIGFLDLLADPLSPRAQAFEKIGLQIQRARLAHPNGPKRKDRRRHAAPETRIEPSQTVPVGPEHVNLDEQADIGNVEWTDPDDHEDSP